MKRFLHGGLLALAAVACLSITGFAAHATEVVVTGTTVALTTDVVIPWGNDLGAIIGVAEQALGAVLLFALTIAARHLPASLSSFVTQQRIAALEPLLEHAIDYALNMAAVAAKDQTVKVNVGSATVATAAQYALDHGAAHLIVWAGGEKGITQKIIARIPTGVLVGSSVPPVVPASVPVPAAA